MSSTAAQFGAVLICTLLMACADTGGDALMGPTQPVADPAPGTALTPRVETQPTTAGTGATAGESGAPAAEPMPTRGTNGDTDTEQAATEPLPEPATEETPEETPEETAEETAEETREETPDPTPEPDDSGGAATPAPAEETSPSLVTVSPQRAQEIIDEAPEGLVVLDVRTPAEFAEGHLPDAILVDFRAPDFEDQLTALDPTVPYVLYCRSGNRSGQSMPIMERLGFQEVYEVDGGIVAWMADSLPVQVP